MPSKPDRTPILPRTNSPISVSNSPNKLSIRIDKKPPKTLKIPVIPHSDKLAKLITPTNTKNRQPSFLDVLASATKVSNPGPDLHNHRTCSCPVTRQNSKDGDSHFSSKWPISYSENKSSGNIDKIPLALYIPTDDGKDTGECKAQSRFIDNNKRDLSLFTRLKMSATIFKENYKETCRYVVKKIEKYNEKVVINSSDSEANKIN